MGLFEYLPLVMLVLFIFVVRSLILYLRSRKSTLTHSSENSFNQADVNRPRRYIPLFLLASLILLFMGIYQTGLHHSEITNALIISAVSFGISILCGYLLNILLAGSAKGRKPIQIGRRWMSIAISASVISLGGNMLANILVSQNEKAAYSFVAMLIGSPILGGAAFLLGFVVAKLRGEMTSDNAEAEIHGKSPSSSLNAQFQRLDVKYKAMIILGAMGIFMASVTMMGAESGYDECIDEYVKNAKTNAAASILGGACKIKYQNMQSSSDPLGILSKEDYAECIFDSVPSAQTDRAASLLMDSCKRKHIPWEK